MSPLEVVGRTVALIGLIVVAMAHHWLALVTRGGGSGIVVARIGGHL